MTETMTELTSPRAKKRVYQSEEAPFPVPIETITKKPASDGRWFYYTGHMSTNCVFVKREGDITFLYKMGFFGKGILSKSKPQHAKFEDSYQGLRKKNLPAKERQFQQQRFQQVRHHKYERHLLWHRQLVQQQAAAQQSNKSQESLPYVDTSDTSEEPPHTVKETENMDCVSSGDTGDVLERPGELSNLNVAQETGPREKRFADDETKGDVPSTSGVGMECCEEKDSTSTNKTDRNESSEVKQGDFKSERTLDGSQSGGSGMSSGRKEEGSGTQETGVTDPQIAPPQRDWMGTTDALIVKATDTDSVKPLDGETLADTTVSCDDVIDEVPMDRENSGGEEFVIAKVLEESEGGGGDGNADGKIAADEPPNSGVGGGADRGDMTRNVVVRKSNPFKIYEYLQLSLEEAFFLSYGLGCLSVLDEGGVPMPLLQMWRTFCARQRNFLANYVAYHYLRSKGWVPKNGVKYGADFVLYKKGPPFYHASYSVLVIMIDEYSTNQSLDTRFWNWGAVTGMNRITENVAKELMVCYVLKPLGIQDAELSSPKCLSRFQVQEVVMKRWVSSRERENHNNDDEALIS